MIVLGIPLLNDIATDREQPPAYLVAPPHRPQFDARDAAVAARRYPDVRNLALAQPAATVFAAAAALVAARGWHEVARSESGAEAPLRLQSVAATRVLRFKDDIVVEVRPRGAAACTVAMRSKSRLGRSDFGANAKRIRAFLADLQAWLRTQ